MAQPVVDVYLSTQIPASRGANFSCVEETHEVLAIKSEKAPTFRIVKKYNSLGKIISEIKYNSAGGVQYEINWDYNIKGEPTRRFMRQFINYKGWTTEEVLFKYSDTTGYLKDIQFFYEKVKKQYAQVDCDSLGRIKELRIFNESGVFTNIERLIYVPANNSLRVMVLRSTEQFIAAHIYPLDYTKQPPKSSLKREYYPNGDIMLETLPDSKMEQGYYYEYNFDSYGNWVEKLTYQCTVTSNNKVKNKKLEHKITRKITY
ncbi:hypothetical protein CYCD_04710 [Tenuifilaceae bacterium CYCD]|nr:hypothetical protein CYCD_04710 [Tenuifilaceae bacterium CYCD]